MAKEVKTKLRGWEITELNSSNLTKMTWACLAKEDVDLSTIPSSTLGILILTFKNKKVYKYLNVPMTVWDKLVGVHLADQSVGKAINELVKPHYKYELIS